MIALVRRIVKSVSCILLVALMLSLGDWPYVDEILAGMSAPQAGEVTASADYQLMLGLQPVAGSAMTNVLDWRSWDSIGSQTSFPLAVMSRQIDRPPKQHPR
jgi:hypothetical protein